MKIMYPVLTAACALTLAGIHFSSEEAILFRRAEAMTENAAPSIASQFAYTLAAYHNPPVMPELETETLDAPVIVVDGADEFTIEDAQDRWHHHLREARATPDEPIKKNLHRPNWPTQPRSTSGGRGSSRSYRGGTFFQQSRFNRGRASLNSTFRGGTSYSKSRRNLSRSRIGRATTRSRSMFSRSRARGGR